MEKSMSIKVNVENLDEVDEKYRDLYTEKDGKFFLSGVEGLKTQSDIERLQSALSKERNDHKAAKERAAIWGDMDYQQVVSQLDRITELEAASKGKIDENKLNELVEGRIKTKLSPLEREKEKLAQALAEKDKMISDFVQKDKTRAIHDAVRSAAAQSKVLPEAMDDALMLAERVFDVDENGKVITRDNVGVTPGVDATVWLSDIQNKRPHWWGPSVGGGATGNRTGGVNVGSNPWSADNWNMTAQAQLYMANKSQAEQMARAAGTTIGGPKPAKK